jgi:2-oxoglutarate dehydrogenase complex dehydrogenase (E1) component-like enzyme
MKAMIDNITDLGCKSIVIGMPHRGRASGLLG